MCSPRVAHQRRRPRRQRGASRQAGRCANDRPGGRCAKGRASRQPPLRQRPRPRLRRQLHQPAAAKPTAAPAAAASGALKDVPRNRQLLLAQGGTQGKYLDYDLWNAYALGANHQPART